MADEEDVPRIDIQGYSDDELDDIVKRLRDQLDREKLEGFTDAEMKKMREVFSPQLQKGLNTIEQQHFAELFSKAMERAEEE